MTEIARFGLRTLRYGINDLTAWRLERGIRVVADGNMHGNPRTSAGQGSAYPAVLFPDKNPTVHSEGQHSWGVTPLDPTGGPHHQRPEIDQHGHSGPGAYHLTEVVTAEPLTAAQRTQLIEQLPDRLTVTTFEPSPGGASRAQSRTCYPMPHPTTTVPEAFANQLRNGIGVTEVGASNAFAANMPAGGPSTNAPVTGTDFDFARPTDPSQNVWAEATRPMATANTAPSMLAREMSVQETGGISIMTSPFTVSAILAGAGLFDGKRHWLTSAQVPTEGHGDARLSAAGHGTAEGPAGRSLSSSGPMEHSAAADPIRVGPSHPEPGSDGTPKPASNGAEQQPPLSPDRSTAVPFSLVVPNENLGHHHPTDTTPHAMVMKFKHGEHHHSQKGHVERHLRQLHTSWYAHFRHTHPRLAADMFRYVHNHQSHSFAGMRHHPPPVARDYSIHMLLGEFHTHRSAGHAPSRIGVETHANSQAIYGYYHAVYQTGHYTNRFADPALTGVNHETMTHMQVVHVFPHS